MKENKKEDIHIEILFVPPNPIIKPWEEINHKKHRTGLGYDKEVIVHIPNYSKTIMLQSVGFIKESSYSSTPLQSSKHQHHVIKIRLL